MCDGWVGEWDDYYECVREVGVEFGAQLSSAHHTYGISWHNLVSSIGKEHFGISYDQGHLVCRFVFVLQMLSGLLILSLVRQLSRLPRTENEKRGNSCMLLLFLISCIVADCPVVRLCECRLLQLLMLSRIGLDGLRLSSSSVPSTFCREVI